MKLVRLSSNIKTFRTIDFHDGLNIIVGTKRDKTNSQETSNGVGKTLSLRCIDFLMGGNRNKDFLEFLENNKITLKLIFTQNQQEYLVERNYNEIFLNEKEISLDDYKQFLYEINIKKYDNKEKFSFRNIFPRFFRFEKKSFLSPTKQIGEEDACINNRINAFLLHLDLELLNRKKELRKKQVELKQAIKTLSDIKNDVNREREIELEEKYQDLEKNLKNFQIADNYYELEKQLDDLTQQIQDLRNEKSIKELKIKNQKKIIKVNQQIDIDTEKIKKIYNETRFFFENSVIEHVDAVKNFHTELFENRKKRAEKTIKTLEHEIEVIEDEYRLLDKKRMELFKELENKGAFDEYQTLIKQKEKIKEELEKIQRGRKLLDDLKIKEADLNVQIGNFKKEIVSLEQELEEHIKKLQIDFRELSSFFYSENKGYLSIDFNKNFTTEKLYNIEPKIDTDKSDGVNSVKIFIYDMLLYKLNPDLIGFVGHDNILFDSVDERQIANAFEYAKNYTKQYICSIHDTKFEEAKNFAKMKGINLEDYVCLKLDEKNKLFGFDFGRYLE